MIGKSSHGGTDGIHRHEPDSGEVAMIVEYEGPMTPPLRVADNGRICFASPIHERDIWLRPRSDAPEMARVGEVDDADPGDPKASKPLRIGATTMTDETTPSIRPREIVILAGDVEGLSDWYVAALGMRVTARFEDLPYVNLESHGGLRIGIGARSSPEELNSGREASVIPQLEAADVGGLLDRVRRSGGHADEPARDSNQGFEFGSFKDPEGNVWWVVDPNCP